jgi:hypothetical protein
MIEYLECHGRPQQEGQEALEDWRDEVLLDPEMENGANSRILDSYNTFISVKGRVGDSHDVPQPAEHWSGRIDNDGSTNGRPSQ